MDDSRAEFDAKDRELLDAARRETEAADAARAAASQDAAAEPDASSEADGAQPQETQPAQPPAVDPAAAPAAKTAAPTPAAPSSPADAQGSAKAALRASRHNERLLREENAALRKRFEESGIAADPEAPDAPDEPDKSQLDDVREYAPAVAKKLDRQQAEIDRLKAALPPGQVAAPAFKPKQYDPETQADIDESPDLLLWQSSPEHQHLFTAAEKLHEAYAQRRDWLQKPAAERFAEVVKDVKAKIAAPSKASTPKTLEDANRVIAAARNGSSAALTVGDLRGGAPPRSNSYPDPYEQVKAGASDETIMSSLPPLP